MSLDDRNRRLERNHHHAFWLGLVASVAVHAALFLVFAGQRMPLSPFAAAGERQRDYQAAEGGGMEAVQLRPPDVVVVPPDPIPVPVVELTEELEPDPEVEEVPEIALADALSVPGTRDPATERGIPDGVGRGDGGSEEEGRFRVVPPRPRGLTLPPGDRPNDVRGKEIEVWVYVSSQGRVVPDSTRLMPSSGDRRFDRRLRDHAAAWVFEAARRDGRAVAEWFRYTIIM